jgi:hypothetical protein
LQNLDDSSDQEDIFETRRKADDLPKELYKFAENKTKSKTPLSSNLQSPDSRRIDQIIVDDVEFCSFCDESPKIEEINPLHAMRGYQMDNADCKTFLAEKIGNKCSTESSVTLPANVGQVFLQRKALQFNQFLFRRKLRGIKYASALPPHSRFRTSSSLVRSLADAAFSSSDSESSGRGFANYTL